MYFYNCFTRDIIKWPSKTSDPKTSTTRNRTHRKGTRFLPASTIVSIVNSGWAPAKMATKNMIQDHLVWKLPMYSLPRYHHYHMRWLWKMGTLELHNTKPQADCYLPRPHRHRHLRRHSLRYTPKNFNCKEMHSRQNPRNPDVRGAAQNSCPAREKRTKHAKLQPSK